MIQRNEISTGSFDNLTLCFVKGDLCKDENSSREDIEKYPVSWEMDMAHDELRSMWFLK